MPQDGDEPKGARILVVDDDDVFRRSTARMLVKAGYECVEAPDGVQARVKLDTDPLIDAVLCDIRMPGKSGMELLREIAEDFADTAVLMTTGVDDPRIAETAFEIGAFGYLIKPIDRNALLINVSGALRRRQLEAQSRAHVRDTERTASRTRALSGVLDRIEDDERDEETIIRLARALSLRDEETTAHIERMSRYAALLAEAVGFTAMTSDEVRLAAALHDVGKIGIPDGVLLKPGPLSQEERSIMHRHARMGFQLLQGSSSPLLTAAAGVAYTHHEWWDGTGYPRGLQGEEIPEEARIAAIADVFDAVTSNRVYRPALPVDEGIAIVRGLSGTKFEPRLVHGFLDSMRKVLEIRDAYPDRDVADTRISVLVVDDQAIFADSLVRLLSSKSQVRVVGTAGTVEAGVKAALAYEPDIVLMDFELPDGDGPAATERIKAALPEVKVVMLTGRTDETALVRAVAAGCCGFVTKTEAVDTLLDAIVSAHEGESISRVTSLAPLLAKLRPTNRGLGASLTRREIEVLDLVAAGMVNKQIARELTVSLNTVRNHVQNILQKLEAHSRLEAVATAVREGVIAYPRIVAGE